MTQHFSLDHFCVFWFACVRAPGYTMIPQNLNAWQTGHDVYLCFAKDSKNVPIVDVQMIAPSLGVR